MLCIIVLIYLILFLLAQGELSIGFYASAVSGTVQSFSIKDARFIIEYIGYFDGYLSVEVCVCTLQKMRQNLPEFLTMCCSYYLEAQRHTQNGTKTEMNCDHAFECGSHAVAAMQELLQSGLCCII